MSAGDELELDNKYLGSIQIYWRSTKNGKEFYCVRCSLGFRVIAAPDIAKCPYCGTPLRRSHRWMKNGLKKNENVKRIDAEKLLGGVSDLA